MPPGLDGYSYRLRRLREHLGIDSTEVLPMLTDPHGCVRTSYEAVPLRRRARQWSAALGGVDPDPPAEIPLRFYSFFAHAY
eukprot:COSAG01_NODE_1641_length_9647_cov_5.299539_8_plen_81_part_00